MLHSWFEFDSSLHFIGAGKTVPFSVGKSHRFIILIVCQGRVTVSTEETNRAIERGDAFVIGPTSRTCALDVASEESDFFCIEFDCNRWRFVQMECMDQDHIYTLQPELIRNDGTGVFVTLDDLRSRDATLKVPECFSLSDLRATCESLNDMVALETLNRVNKLDSESLFRDLLIRLFPFSGQKRTPTVDLAEAAVRFIRTNYKSQINYDVLQRALNYNARYILRCMKRTYGCSPIDYLLRTRIDRAKVLLMHSDLGIHEIATRVGFEETRHFSRVFLKLENLSPRDFRKHAHVSKEREFTLM